MSLGKRKKKTPKKLNCSCLTLLAVLLSVYFSNTSTRISASVVLLQFESRRVRKVLDFVYSPVNECFRGERVSVAPEIETALLNVSVAVCSTKQKHNLVSRAVLLHVSATPSHPSHRQQRRTCHRAKNTSWCKLHFDYTTHHWL